MTQSKLVLVVRTRILLTVLTALAAFAASPTEILQAVRENGLDPTACYRRPRSLLRQGGRAHLFKQGLSHLHEARSRGAARARCFRPTSKAATAKLSYCPPTRSERQSLARFTSSANLDEHLNAGFMVFADGTAEDLIDRITKEQAGRPAPEMGALLASQWSPTTSKIGGPMALRLVQDLLDPAKPGTGLAFLALSGKTLGNFDIIVEPRGATRVEVRKETEHDQKLTSEIWTSFPARSARVAAKAPPPPDFSFLSYRIDAGLDGNLHLKASTQATLRIGPRATTSLVMMIARDVDISAVRLDGKPVDILRGDAERRQLASDDPESALIVVAPAPLAALSQHTLEFEHAGNIVHVAGENVFFVADRESWYPHTGSGAATFDVSFRYPKKLTLVSAGDLVSDRTDGDWRTTRRRIMIPIGSFGFDLGEYEKVSAQVNGVSIDVYGNRHLEDSLRPPVELVQAPPSPTPGRRGRGPQSQLGNLTIAPPVQTAPDPLGRLKAVAADVSSAVEFFSGLFGPPALKTLTVAPIPGTFGQGFPGMVYLSTFAYLDPRERPAALRSAREQAFYSDVLAAHETAHQWWGAVISIERNEDSWLLESLANYSAVLWLEKKRGFKEALAVLDGYRDQLLEEADGKRTPESAGPIVWGDRLLSSDIPNAWEAVTYGKGVWVLHMLRRRMGDERFLAMLAEFRKRYEFRVVTTEAFRALVQEFRPRDVGAEAMDAFFDNWVYATGVPTLKLTYKTAAPLLRSRSPALSNRAA